MTMMPKHRGLRRRGRRAVGGNPVPAASPPRPIGEMPKIFVDPRARRNFSSGSLLRHDSRRASPSMAPRELTDGSGAIRKIFRIYGEVNLYWAAAACGET